MPPPPLLGYYHKSFLKGRRDLCFEIQRQKVKGTFVRKPAVPENEPNFYKMGLPPQVTTKPTGPPRAWGQASTWEPTQDEIPPLASGAPSRSWNPSLFSVVSSNTDSLAAAMMQNMITSCKIDADEHNRLRDANLSTFRKHSLTHSSFYEPFELNTVEHSHFYIPPLPQSVTPEDMKRSFDTLLASLRG